MSGARLALRTAACLLVAAGLSALSGRAGEADPAAELILSVGIPLGQRAAAAGKLLAAAASTEEARRALAEEAIGRLGSQDAALAGVYAGALSDSRPEVRVTAVRALVRLGSSDLGVLQALANMSRDRETATRIAVARAMSAGGPAARASILVLAAMLADREPEVRAEAAAALGRLGPAAKPALQNMVNMLGDKDAGVRRAAVRALGRTGDAAVLNVLLGFVQNAREDTDLEAGCAAVFDLGDAAAGGRAALQSLVYGRRARWGPVDAWGLAALARISPAGDAPAKDLVAFLKDDARKLAAARAVERLALTGSGEVEALLAGLRDPAVAASCARALGRSGAALRGAGGVAPAAGRIAAALAGVLESDDEALVAAALRAIGDIGAPESAEEVRKRAERFGGAAEIWSQYALCRLKQDPGKAMGRLRAMAEDPWRLRGLAWTVLQYLEAGGRGEIED